ncbi:PREDICTED: olfactory receptor 1019-like [Nanorana parkeri]|uniref:olfactory receptor 1019-like n=1 Tax=Nanorana parkeri TaxID=125878 RepID=UPI000854B17B|nr:PREDICTED: olfactory receptor 1019-like [Nanorana parkeri]
MENSNHTYVRRFILLGLSDVPSLQAVFFFLFLLMYIFTFFGNVLLIVMVILNAQLWTPMYLFLCNLSAIDICFSSTVVPKILINTITQDKSISFFGCAAQLYFHLALGGTECLILAVMAYDRYTAICKPLQYNAIMHKKLCRDLVVGCWTVSFLNSFILTFFTFRLPFCKSNLIRHFFCEMPPLFHLSCQDTWFNEMAKYISVGLIVLGSFLLILLSYLCITLTILNIHSTRERKKAFSTCASHLMVVSLYYGTIMLMHLRPRSAYSPQQNRVVTILYTVVTPMLNPIIYSIRNKDVKGAIRKTMCIAVYQ